MSNENDISHGILFIISAPSGGGKTSLVTELLKQISDLKVSVSHTTRPMRVGEIEGKSYYFVDEKTFLAHQQSGVFLECAQVFDNWYGTGKQTVVSDLASGFDVILEIDWQGAQQIRKVMNNCVSIFILPPSRQTLMSRLRQRQSDKEEVIEKRIDKASEEISHYKEYDYLVINDDFAQALADLRSIIRTHRLNTKRQSAMYAPLIDAWN